MKSRISFIYAIIWALIILVFSGVPGNSIKLPPIWNADKILHLIVYMVLSVLLVIGFFFSKKSKSFLNIIFLTISLSTIYGGVIELLQHYFFIGRYGDVLDFVANTIGAVIGALSVYLIKPILRFLKRD